MKLKRWDMVRIEWDDPQPLRAIWEKPSKKDMMTAGCLTVGFVYKLHSDRITIGSTYDRINKHVNGGITIPLGCITSIEHVT